LSNSGTSVIPDSLTKFIKCSIPSVFHPPNMTDPLTTLGHCPPPIFLLLVSLFVFFQSLFFNSNIHWHPSQSIHPKCFSKMSNAKASSVTIAISQTCLILIYCFHSFLLTTQERNCSQKIFIVATCCHSGCNCCTDGSLFCDLIPANNM